VTTTAPDRPASPAASPDLLIREARQRRRRRYLAIALAVAAGAGLVSAALSFLGMGTGHPAAHRHAPPSRSSASPAPPTAPTIPSTVRATVLIWTYQHPTWLEQPGSNRFRRSWKPELAAGDNQPSLIRVGRWLVYVGDGTSAIRVDLSGRPRKLWTNVHAQPGPFMPAAQPGHVWLVFRNQRPGWSRRPERARLVSVPAGRLGQAVRVPTGFQLVAGTDRGLLLTAKFGALELWNPGSQPRPLPRSRPDDGAYAYGFAASPRLIAYGTRCGSPGSGRWQDYIGCRVLRVYDVVTRQLVSIPAPPGTLGWAPYEFNRVFAFAPGGEMIAATAESRSGGPGLYVVRLDRAHPQVSVVPDSPSLALACVAWSPGGSWLFYPGPGSRLWAFQPATGHVRSSTLPSCRDSGVMVAFHSG
jgi:hypothetical protein